MRIAGLIVGVALGATGLQPAAAQKLDPRLETIIACPRITDPAQRLACFDSAVAPLSQAATTGALVARSGGPTALQGKIRTVRQQGSGRALVQLGNGDRWSLQLKDNDVLPKVGADVTVRRGALGNWFFKVTNGRTFQASFLNSGS